MENQNDKLHIKFEGKKLESGTIDAYDLAITVLATADTLRAITSNIPSTKNASIKIDVNALKPGSFEVDLFIQLSHAVDLGIAVIPFVNVGAINQVKEIIHTFQSLIDIRKFLKGENPAKVEIQQKGKNSTSEVVLHNFNGDHMTVNFTTYNVMQDKTVNEKLKKVFTPMLKDGGEVEVIKITNPADGADNENKVEISKEEAKFFERTEELQTVPTFKIRGIVTAMDRKTVNGKLTTGEEKRCNFEIDIDDISKLNKVVDGLIDSMRSKTQVLVIGEAVIDLDGEVKKMKVKDIETDKKLFE